MAAAQPTAGGPASNTVRNRIAAERAAWKAVGDATELPARQEEAEAHAREATAAVLEARPTDPAEMAALLRWIIADGRGGGCTEPDCDEIIEHVADQLAGDRS